MTLLSYMFSSVYRAGKKKLQLYTETRKKVFPDDEYVPIQFSSQTWKRWATFTKPLSFYNGNNVCLPHKLSVMTNKITGVKFSLQLSNQCHQAWGKSFQTQLLSLCKNESCFSLLLFSSLISTTRCRVWWSCNQMIKDYHLSSKDNYN